MTRPFAHVAGSEPAWDSAQPLTRYNRSLGTVADLTGDLAFRIDCALHPQHWRHTYRQAGSERSEGPGIAVPSRQGILLNTLGAKTSSST